MLSELCKHSQVIHYLWLMDTLGSKTEGSGRGRGWVRGIFAVFGSHLRVTEVGFEQGETAVFVAIVESPTHSVRHLVEILCKPFRRKFRQKRAYPAFLTGGATTDN